MLKKKMDQDGVGEKGTVKDEATATQGIFYEHERGGLDREGTLRRGASRGKAFQRRKGDRGKRP